MAAPTYTFAQAAGELGVREDDLSAILTNAGIDLTGRTTPTLTPPEMERLSRLVRDLHALHREGPFDGIDE